MEEIVIRDYVAFVDDNFIFDSWMHSYYGHSPMTMMIPKKEYQDKHSKLISKLIAVSTIRIASDPNDRELIIGYILYQPDIIHYVYVKEQFRRLGICNQLLDEAKAGNGTRVTHMTIRCKNIADRKRFVYSPYFNL